MCGITGVFNFKSKKKVDLLEITNMTNAIKHRGPDDEGFFVNDYIGLGFRRLSIIDLKNGSQPMQSNSGRFHIIFNGEIYNYKYLQNICIQNGYELKTSSDTETILALFEIGIKQPEKLLDGMFSFALYDSEKKELRLSRDESGKKPLFYILNDDGIIFSSEQKSFFTKNKKKPDINKQAVSDFLTLSYLPIPETIFENTKQVKPGTILSCKEKIVTISSYITKNLNKKYINKSNIKKETTRFILSSVEKRLQTDVPIGLFLSGGIDSSLLLSMTAKLGFPKDFKTFTVGFEDKNFSESHVAKSTSDYFGVPNETYIMNCSNFIDVFDKCVWHCDNILANPATFAYTYLCEKASKSVKVALHGGGADELFFGYETYQANEIAKIFDLFPRFINVFLSNVFNKLGSNHSKLSFDYKIKKFFKSINFEPEERHHEWRTIFTESEKKQFLNGFSNLDSSYDHYKNSFENYRNLTFRERTSIADFEIWWKSMGNYQADVTGMSTGLELRLPFMHKSLVKFISSLPEKDKFSIFRKKNLLKNIGRDFLPQNLLNMPKSGFHIPLAEWFRGPLIDFMMHHISLLKKHEYFRNNDRIFDNIIYDHINMKDDNSFKIINLVVLSKFLQIHDKL